VKYLFKFLALAFLICCVVLVITFAARQKSFSKDHHIQNILSKIPKEDYDALDKLFRCLVFENYFAYTLFGGKPMTYHGAFYDQPTATLDHPNSALIFLTNWKTWEKYANLPEFEMNNFVFIEEKRPELFGIHFINKKNILQCVKDNLDIFQEVLGENITPEAVLQSLLSGEDIYEALKDSHILYGILFGFGAENARAFHEKFELGLSLPEPVAFHQEDPDLHLLPLPYFSVFYPNKATDRLRKQYMKEREQILQIYEKGNFLEITLSRLLSKK